MDLIFEKSRPGAGTDYFPALGAPLKHPESFLPAEVLRGAAPELPELSELDVVRHYMELSRRQIGVDSVFYPLGSCTMKYNPKVNEAISRLDGLARLHPMAPEACCQGAMRIYDELQRSLCEITGMDEFTLAPMAGAHGELTGMMIVKAHHAARREARTKILVPASAHGTNPASAAMCGYEVVTVPGDDAGEVDLESLKNCLDGTVAAVMLTNPNTLGLFETKILDICKAAHDAGALCYYDGANLNAILGVVRPGDMGFDVIHLNLHKTFATPHGGGGPGAGPVGVKSSLAEFLPVPYVKRVGDWYSWSEDRPRSIGRVSGFYGNAGILFRAFAYIRRHGPESMASVAQHAVLNSAYVRKRLSKSYRVASDKPPMHEFVVTPTPEMLANHVQTVNIAKRLIDLGYHPPTVYFPLVVKEAIMVEPTETESKATLDRFCEAMEQIAREAIEDPKKVIDAPHNAPVARVDEVKAAKDLNLRFVRSM